MTRICDQCGLPVKVDRQRNRDGDVNVRLICNNHQCRTVRHELVPKAWLGHATASDRHEVRHVLTPKAEKELFGSVNGPPSYDVTVKDEATPALKEMEERCRRIRKKKPKKSKIEERRTKPLDPSHIKKMSPTTTKVGMTQRVAYLSPFGRHPGAAAPSRLRMEHFHEETLIHTEECDVEPGPCSTTFDCEFDLFGAHLIRIVDEMGFGIEQIVIAVP